MFGLASGIEPTTKLATQHCDVMGESIHLYLININFVCDRFHTQIDGTMANNGLLHGRYSGILAAVHGDAYRDKTLAPHTQNAMAGYHLGGLVHYDFIQHMK